MMIEINNLTTNPINEEFLKKTAKIVLEGEESKLSSSPTELSKEAKVRKRIKSSFDFAVAREGELEISKYQNIELSIALVGQGRIKALNKKYRKRNRITDVLAFSYNDSGEVIVCLGEVKKNAKRFGSVFKKELARVLIHGILHLLGYDHEKNKIEAKKMEEKEEYYLSKILNSKF